MVSGMRGPGDVLYQHSCEVFLGAGVDVDG